MSLQKKLSIIFVIITIIPLLAVGFLSYQILKNRSIEQISAQLVSISSIQEKRVNEVLGRYLEQVQSITSRTQLRASVKKYRETRDTSTLVTIQKIIQDTKESIQSIKQVSVLDTQGVVLASTDASLIGQGFGSEEYFKEGLKTNQLHDVFKDEDNLLRIRLSGPFILEGQVIGVAVIVLDADSIVAVTEDYAGLGTTGEVILAKKNQAGDALFLTPLRFDAGAALHRAITKEELSNPIVSAILGHEDILLGQGIRDYRGKPVFASTRFIESLGWGMVAKIDQAEVLSPVNDLLKSFLLIAFFIVLFAIAIALVIGRVIFRPIGELTAIASNLQNGDFSQRVHIRTKDEIGTLGDAFNSMAEKLQELYLGLEQKVADRTKALQVRTDESEMMNTLMVGRELKMIELKKEIEDLKK